MSACIAQILSLDPTKFLVLIAVILCLRIDVQESFVHDSLNACPITVRGAMMLKRARMAMAGLASQFPVEGALSEC